MSMDLSSKSVLLLTTLGLHLIFLGCPVFGYRNTLKTSSRKSLDLYAHSPISAFKNLDRLRNRLDGNGNSQTILKVVGDNGGSLSSSGTGIGTTGSNYRSKLRDLPSVRNTLFLHSGLDDDLEDEDEDSSYSDDLNETQILNDNIGRIGARNYSYKHAGYYHHRQQHFLSEVPISTTTPPRTTTSPPYSYSDWKWDALGTRQAVDQRFRHSYSQSRHNNNNNHNGGGGGGGNIGTPSRLTQQQHGGHSSAGRQHGQPQTPDTSIREAINHALKVSREGGCRIPKPRLVRVQDFYPHPGKAYVPHCTILHHCSDDTGCCRHDVLTCSPKTTQRVELYFYSILADNTRASTVERLVFYNHTECECRDKMEDSMPRDVPVSSGPSIISNAVNPGNSLLSSQSKFSLPNTRTTLDRNFKCNCPSMFTERVLSDGSCTCDCFDKERECLRLKRGIGFFTMDDKWCIHSGQCEKPTCSYGSYYEVHGRCQRKREKTGESQVSWSRYRTN